MNSPRTSVYILSFASFAEQAPFFFVMFRASSGTHALSQLGPLVRPPSKSLPNGVLHYGDLHYGEWSEFNTGGPGC